jgi:hypothetical protein
MTKVLSYFRPLASLRLTLTSLGLMMMLVFFGTLAQVQIGTFAAQKQYFSSVFIYGEPFGFRMPILPGGFLVGALWLINLTAAFVFQFRFVRKKAGLLISHFGVILLLSGQFLAQTLARESQMPIEVGQSKNYSESQRDFELAFTLTSNPDYDEVTAIPQSRFRRPGLISAPALPFRILIKKYYANANLGMNAGGGASLATQGIGTRVNIEDAPPVSSDDEANNVSVFLQILDGDRDAGTWLVSAGLGAPQSVQVQGKTYSMEMRPRRFYYPFTIKLEQFHHDIYPGTDIPKNFSSRIRLINPEKNEDRVALIYMNHPLRYEGNTFYQASFGKGDTVSIFQVMKNPAWITPYLSCSLVVLGLAIHFMMSLVAFMRRRSS